MFSNKSRIGIRPLPSLRFPCILSFKGVLVSKHTCSSADACPRPQLSNEHLQACTPMDGTEAAALTATLLLSALNRQQRALDICSAKDPPERPSGELSVPGRP